MNDKYPEIIPVPGGFTASEKFITKLGSDEAQWSFSKQADFSQHPDEKRILETEATMYAVISTIPSVAKYFPHLRSSSVDSENGLIELDYLSNVSWGGPFTARNIHLLAAGLHDIHSTPLSTQLIKRIKSSADELLDYVYTQSEYAFDDEQKAVLFEKLFIANNAEITNSRGVSYFDDVDTARDILEYSREYERFDGNSLLLADLNFGNIAFSNDQVYFVDPVYLNVGKASSDNITAGLNILRVLMQDEAPDETLVSQVCELFMDDRNAFAYTLAYCMACTTLPYRGEKDEWMDLHQELSEVGLVIWQKMYA